MRRRELITLLGGAAVWPLAAWAQQASVVRRVGVLMNGDESDPACKVARPFGVARGPAHLDAKVLSLDPSELAQRL